jgi:hypothetical protein
MLRDLPALRAKPVIAAMACAVGALLPLPALGATCGARSGASTVALVELYTSEGCDSCPPADRWLAGAFRGNADTARAIPLAFHVDYWDRLGWKDRFASAAFTERQYAAMRANHTGFVYTPQVLVQGHDFSGWRGTQRSVGDVTAAANARPARADIALEAAAQPAGVAVRAQVRVPDVADRKGAIPYVALVDSGLVSDVRAGENAGARLTHDHVVRAFRAGAAVDASGVGGADVVLPWPSEAGHDAAIVAFVQNAQTGDVFQALALPLRDPACAARR